MAYTTINKSTDYFNTKLWSGNGSSQALTGVGHQTDMAWIKSRTDTRKHNLYDAVRGVQKRIVPNDTVAEDTVPGVTAFGTDGFTVGSETDTNGSSRNFVGWSWKAGAGQGSSNTDGSINTTYTSVNTTAGFSISTYTGTGSAATIGHGLGAAPEVVIIKCTTASENWVMYNKNLGAGKYIFPNTTAAVGPGSGTNTSYFNNTAPTSSVFSVGNDGGTNNNNGVYVAYCFKEKKGYSKFGKYIGNGSSDGTFVYTGFKPSWVIIKRTDTSDTWTVWDNKRVGYNSANYVIEADNTNAEASSDRLDILSNGFKLGYNWTPINSSGGTYIYMAFGQSLVGSNNVPCTAR